MKAVISDEAAMAVFVGPQFAYYRERWEWAAVHNGVAWNWAAFAFGPFWMAYRRMYWQVGVYAIAICAEPVLQAFFHIRMPLVLGRPLLYALALLLGFYGNQFYKWHADATIRRLREYHWSPELVNDSLARCGRPSWTGVVAMAVLIAVMVVALRPLSVLVV